MMKKNRPFSNPKVENIFNLYDPKVKKQLLLIRELIFATANKIDIVGEITETLKWNEPSYAPVKPKVGSPIRINGMKEKTKFAIYFNCQTNLITTFKQLYPKTFNYVGNRSIVFDLKDQVPIKELEHCISMALTYHKTKLLLTASP